jgi:hypothetical protein
MGRVRPLALRAEIEAAVLGVPRLAIDTLAIIRGRLSARAHALVVEWASLHSDELRADWELARSGLPLRRIAPLR